MKQINPNIHPKDGYRFRESDGSWHVGGDWNGVIARVAAYRRRQGKPMGDVKAEVIAQACSRNPIICTEVNAATQEQLKKSSLKTRTLNFLNALRGKTNDFVEDGVAKARAAICASCPRNSPLNEGCSSCRNALIALRKEIIGGRHSDGRLNSCEILGEDLPTAINLDSQTVENGELPGHCWRRRSL